MDLEPVILSGQVRRRKTNYRIITYYIRNPEKMIQMELTVRAGIDTSIENGHVDLWGRPGWTNWRRPHKLWVVPTRLLHPWNFQTRILGAGCHFLPRNLPTSRNSNSKFASHTGRGLYQFYHGRQSWGQSWKSSVEAFC